MRRRHVTEEDDISLFPFLSIIAAIIGVLTLMIAAVTLGQMNQNDVKGAVENAIAMEILEKKIASTSGDIEKLKLNIEKEKAKALQNSSERQKELVKTRAELNDLIAKLESTRAEIEEQRQIKIVIPEAPVSQRETVADLEVQLAEIQKRLALLRKSLAERKKPPAEAEVSILPGGTGLSFKPQFVECAAAAIVMHTESPPLTIRTAEMAANKKFVALLEKVANQKDHTVIFLVRSDGLNTYRAAKRLCDTNNVRNGKLPVAGQGKLDFSHFNK